jgi:hypothetical protein
MNIVIFLYQAIVLLVRTGAVYFFGHNILSDKQMMLLQLDYSIMLCLILLKGGVGHVAWLGKLVAFPGGQESLCAVRPGGEVSEARAEYDSLKGLERVISRIVKYGFQVFQLALVIALCAIGSVLLEGAVVCVAFIVYGFLIQRRWHSKSILICTLFAPIAFFSMGRLFPAFQYSQFILILAAFGLCYGLYRKALKDEAYEAMCVEHAALTSRNFICETATTEELRARMLELGKNDEDIDFAFKAFRSGIPQKILADDYMVTLEAIKKRKQRLKRELEALG